LTEEGAAMPEQDPRSSTASEPSETGETGAREQAKEYADQAKNKASDIADQAKNKTGEMADAAKERAEAGKGQAASSLEHAAQVTHERAAESEGMPAQAGTKVADVMEDTAKYLRTHDTNEIWRDVESYAKSHPLQTLAGAVVGGFVLGKLIS
jgi:ElaB/YqjD/DUF883 family membrane-anchored ribosome-binding protein